MEPCVCGEIRERLDDLERDSRQWRWACAIMIGAIGMIGLEMSKLRRIDREINAQRLVIRDEQGRVRGRLGMDDFGDFGLKLIAQNGEPLVNLGSTPDGTAMLGLSQSGQLRAMLSTVSDGSVLLNFYDRNQALAHSIRYPDSPPRANDANGPDAALASAPAP